MGDESYFSPEMLRQMLLNTQKQSEQTDSDKGNSFTQREQEVLNLLCAGLSVTEIAEKIFLSVKTIETHRAALLRKTNTRNTINLVLYAIKNKLVEI